MVTISTGGQLLLFFAFRGGCVGVGKWRWGGNGGCEACQILMSLTQQKTLFRSFQIWLDHRNQDGQ